LQDGEPLGFVLSNVVTLKRQVRSFSEEVTEVTPPLPAIPNLKTEREDPFDQMVRGVTPDRGEDFYSSFSVGIRILLDHCTVYFRRFKTCRFKNKTTNQGVL
jgi:hypothetical protein